MTPSRGIQRKKGTPTFFTSSCSTKKLTRRPLSLEVALKFKKFFNLPHLCKYVYRLNGCLYGSLLIRFKFLRRATNLLALSSEQNIQSKCEYPKVHRTRMICLSSVSVVWPVSASRIDSRKQNV
ncbi:unnamed protein product [Brugia pahangi]|uniref:Uncharacterized protein n=1 Tax=Brugia pahangi TaxID=6280 RepID=A0A0N4TWY5_BRUPA|nr:unnamed protein product [Brugia pahangi]